MPSRIRPGGSRSRAHPLVSVVSISKRAASLHPTPTRLVPTRHLPAYRPPVVSGAPAGAMFRRHGDSTLPRPHPRRRPLLRRGPAPGRHAGARPVPSPSRRHLSRTGPARRRFVSNLCAAAQAGWAVVVESQLGRSFGEAGDAIAHGEADQINMGTCDHQRGERTPAAHVSSRMLLRLLHAGQIVVLCGSLNDDRHP